MNTIRHLLPCNRQHRFVLVKRVFYHLVMDAMIRKALKQEPIGLNRRGDSTLSFTDASSKRLRRDVIERASLVTAKIALFSVWLSLTTERCRELELSHKSR